MIEFEEDKRTAEEIEGSFLVPGKYHVWVTDAEERVDPEKGTKSVVMSFQILAGDMPGQEGRSHTEWFATRSKKGTAAAEKAIKDRLRRLAMSLGMLKPNERKGVEFSDAKGKQMVIEIEEQEWGGKKRSKIALFGMWHVNSPDVSDVPRGDVPELTPIDTVSDAKVEAAKSANDLLGTV